MTGPSVAHGVLGFADKKQDGRLSITGADGRPVAYVLPRWTGSSFTAATADGQALCSARKRNAFSRYLDVLDAAGAPLASLRSGWGSKKWVELPDGRELTVSGRWSSRDWTMTDSAGAALLAATAQAAGGPSTRMPTS